MDDTGVVIKRVEGINWASPEAESTLMDGYARALALEAAQVRLERRFTELAQDLTEDHDSVRLSELRSLRQRISRTEAELTRLRAVLAVGRQRFAAAFQSAAS